MISHYDAQAERPISFSRHDISTDFGMYPGIWGSTVGPLSLRVSPAPVCQWGVQLQLDARASVARRSVTVHAIPLVE
eukprot:3610967-Rhodomonas_salina.1